MDGVYSVNNVNKQKKLSLQSATLPDSQRQMLLKFMSCLHAILFYNDTCSYLL